MATITHHSSPTAPRIAEEEAVHLVGRRWPMLKVFVRRLQERVALVPSGEIVFAVLGDPFGEPELAWLGEGGVYRFRELARARGLSDADASGAMNRLRWALRSHATEPRHAVAIRGKQVEVIPSDHLAAELRRVVSEVLS